MPYITQKDREKYDEQINDIVETLPNGNDNMVGELNYVISSIMKRYMDTHGEKYARYNALFGALNCAGREFYIRFVRPYEDKAIEKNGDI